MRHIFQNSLYKVTDGNKFIFIFYKKNKYIVVYYIYMIGPWYITPTYKNSENVIINGSLNLTNPDESINFTNQLALILDYMQKQKDLPIFYYKIQIIGGPYDGRIAPSVKESNEISKKN